LTQDPIRHIGGTNLYTYVANQPVAFVDPLGLQYGEAAMFFSGGELYSNLTLHYIINELVVPGPYGSPNPEDWGEWTSLPHEAGKYGECYERLVWGAIWTATGAEAVAIGLIGAEMLGISTNLSLHGPHHSFRLLGKTWHIQINWWRVGIKGTGGALRIPLPWW
jgi:hypothetical protein